MAEDATELTATQFVILAENQRKKKALADAKGQFARVAEENKALSKQLEDAQQENYEVTEHLRLELLDKMQKITDLQAQLAKSKEDAADEAKRLEELSAVREARQAEQAATETASLKSQIAELQAQLSSVANFRAHQVEVEEELLKAKEEVQELKEQLGTQRGELERYYLELSTKQRKEWEQKLEEVKKASEEEVEERLDASVKRILQQNRRMAEELRIHVQETDVLQQEVRILEEERGRLMRELALKAELEEGYAKRGAAQAGALKAASAKITTLEGSLSQVLADFEKERNALAKNSTAQVTEAQAEVEALRRLIKLKTRELKNIRRLAQEVLLQRSDVEAFLLSSLHHVRKEMERDSLLLGSRTANNNYTFMDGPTTYEESRSGQPVTAVQAETGRLDLKDLGWADRERVIRLLFAKINNQAQQQHYAYLPPHPLETQATKGTDAG